MQNKFLPLLFLLVSISVFPQKKQKKNKIDPPTLIEIKSSTATERWAAHKNRQELSQNSLIKNIKFRSAGPTVMSGRVADIDVNNEKPSEFYVAYATGGLWKTVNNGQSFTPIFDNEAVGTLGDIAVDWNAKNRTIWAGTGESISSRSSYAGLGVYKSDDDGKTWQHKGLDETHHIGEIKIHPNDPNTVWVAALGHLYTANKDRGIFKTSDGGNTWKNTLFVDENTGAIDLTIDPNNPKILYACMWQKSRRAWNFEESGSGTGIYKSTDGGDTWENITKTESGFPQGASNGRVGIAVSPTNSSIVYAILDNQAKQPDFQKKESEKLDAKKIKVMTKEQFLALSNTEINEFLDSERFPEKYNAKTLKESVASNKIQVTDIGKYTENANDDLYDTPIIGAELFRSENGGKTWTKTHKNHLDWIFNTYGYVFSTIHVAPDNPDKVVIPGYQLIKSEDGGKTFESMNAPNVHADHHVVWMNPKDNNHMILGNDGGLNITYDNGKTWIFANSPSLGMFYAIQVDMATPYNIYGGLQDNGVWTGPSTYKANNEWHATGQYPYKSILGGDGMYVAVDTRDNNTVYTGYQFGNYFKVNKTTGQTKNLEMPQEIGGLKNRFNWQSPIFISEYNQDILFFGGNKLFRSTDKGEKWEALSDDLTKGAKVGDVPYGTITTMAESPKRMGLIYVGTDDGNIQISKDGGYTFSIISDKLPQNLWVSRVIASKFSEGAVYASLNGYRNDDFTAYLYKSDDYGQNWMKIGENLPNEPINVVREDPKNEQIIYVGNDHGVYVSINKGNTFMAMNNGMPTIPVHDLVIHPRDNDLVVGTHGRSIYIANVENLQKMHQDSLLQKDLHIFDLKPLTFQNNWGKINGDEKYDKIKSKEYLISFFTRNSGVAKVKIFTNRRFLLKQWEQKYSVGFNETSWDLAIDSTAAFDYGIILNSQRKSDSPVIKLEKADDNKVYIRPGKYILEIENEQGKKIEKELEVKAIERKSKRSE